MAVATSDSMEVTTNRDVTNEQLATELAVTDTPPVEETTTEQPAPAKSTAQRTEPPVETSTDEPADEPDPASEAGKKLAGKRKSMQQRIDELTWQKHQEAARREEAEKQLQALKAPKQEPAPAADDRPKLKSFVDQIGSKYDTYEDAVDAHADALSEYKLAARDQASVAAQHHHARQQTLHHVTTRGQDAHADFDAVLGEFVQQGGRFAPLNAQEANGPLGDLESVILQHPLGHLVAYEVAKDPGIRQALLGATSRPMFMDAMGDLITRLKGAPTGSPAKAAPVSKAKQPIQPVGSSPVASDPDPDEIPFGPAYVRTMNRKFGK